MSISSAILALRTVYSREARLFHIRLRRGNSCHWHAERTAGNISQAESMAELDGARVAAMFAADAVFDAGLAGLRFPYCHFHEFAHAALVERYERITLDEFLREVLRDELGDIVTREAVGHLGEIIGPEAHEFHITCNTVRADTCTRGFHHGAYLV